VSKLRQAHLVQKGIEVKRNSETKWFRSFL
jgi:hypothetical protein